MFLRPVAGLTVSSQEAECSHEILGEDESGPPRRIFSSTLAQQGTTIAKISQISLYSWEQTEPMGDLQRLQCVLDVLLDEALMRVLEQERGKGRDAYPVSAVWNSLLAGIVFQHPTIERLIRAVVLSGPPRQQCGLRPGVIPPPSVYTRLLPHLLDHEPVLD